ncbi:thioredoxin fold domain-containing protein [Acidithiobacillus ferrivorans]|nr:thioredoxin fold domain-containing protein [Acidithiobacillus ferrivorans]
MSYHRFKIAGLTVAVALAISPLMANAGIAQPAVNHMSSFASASPVAKISAHDSASRLLASVSHGNLKLISTFKGPGPHVTGIIGKTPAGQKVLAWMIDDQFLSPGPLFNSLGANLTMQAAQSQHITPTAAPVSTVASGMMKAPGFMWGKSGPIITAFLDPNCIFCHKFYTEVEHEVAAGKLRVKMVPVGFLKPSSLPKAATIMMSKNPETAWNHNEIGFNDAHEEGATIPAKHISNHALQVINANTHLLASSGSLATPTIVACIKNSSGGKPVLDMIRGLPRGSIQPFVLSLDGNVTDHGCS